MKKTTTFFGLCAIALLLTVACKEKRQETKKPTGEVTDAMVKAPKQIISLAEADSLYLNYKKRRVSSIYAYETAMQDANAKPFIPTQFVTFNLDVLKNYITYIEQQAKKGGTTVDSLRIYLGNYGDTQQGWKKKRRNTVFMLPAAKAENGYGGIYIGADGTAKLISNYFKNPLEKATKAEAALLPTLNSNLIQPGGTSLILNRNGADPPPPSDFE